MEGQRTTDWVVPGLIIGNGFPRLLICVTLDGTAYFADDTPVPSVGQDDELQPVYGIYQQNEDGSIDFLAAFYDKDDFITFVRLMDKAVGYMLKHSTHLATMRIMEALTPKEEEGTDEEIHTDPDVS